MHTRVACPEHTYAEGRGDHRVLSFWSFACFLKMEFVTQPRAAVFFIFSSCRTVVTDVCDHSQMFKWVLGD